MIMEYVLFQLMFNGCYVFFLDNARWRIRTPDIKSSFQYFTTSAFNHVVVNFCSKLCINHQPGIYYKGHFHVPVDW